MQRNDGYYLWTLNGDESELFVRNGCVYELSNSYYDAEDLDNGTITPLVAMTPDVREALEAVIGVAEYDLSEGYRRDDELQQAVQLLRAMLGEQEATHDDTSTA